MTKSAIIPRFHGDILYGVQENINAFPLLAVVESANILHSYFCMMTDLVEVSKRCFIALHEQVEVAAVTTDQLLLVVHSLPGSR